MQALTGIMTRLGEPGQPPIYLGMGSGDAMGGMMAAFAIMLALYARQHTGRGQFLDASLYGAQLFMAAPTLQAYLATGDAPLREATIPSQAPQRFVEYATKRKTSGWSSALTTTTATMRGEVHHRARCGIVDERHAFREVVVIAQREHTTS